VGITNSSNSLPNSSVTWAPTFAGCEIPDGAAVKRSYLPHRVELGVGAPLLDRPVVFGGQPSEFVHFAHAQSRDGAELLHALNNHSPRYVTESTPVVKSPQSTRVGCSGTVRPMSKFKDRIDWILANRPLFRGSISRLSIAIGMSRTSLAKTVERSEANRGVQKMEDHNLKALAEKAQVSEEWLRTGNGSPDAVLPKISADLELRRDAAEMLQAGHELTEERAWLLMRDAVPDGPGLKHYYLAGLKMLRREPASPQSIPVDVAETFLAKNRRRVRT
jgi:hypothetical protein